MLSALEQSVIPFLENLYALCGYVGVVIAMAIESCCIPLPSELIMPMAGWMVARGEFDLWIASLAGAFGCLVGSVIAYWVGAYGGRPLLERYGKYVLINTHELDVADRWFAKYGDATVFFSRLLPVVRTFISFPAGVTRMHFVKFMLYSFLGSVPWCFALTYAGKALGDNWEAVKKTLGGLDYVIVGVIVLLVLYFIYRKVRRPKKAATTPETQVAVSQKTDSSSAGS